MHHSIDSQSPLRGLLKVSQSDGDAKVAMNPEIIQRISVTAQPISGQPNKFSQKFPRGPSATTQFYHSITTFTRRVRKIPAVSFVRCKPGMPQCNRAPVYVPWQDPSPKSYHASDVLRTLSQCQWAVWYSKAGKVSTRMAKTGPFPFLRWAPGGGIAQTTIGSDRDSDRFLTHHGCAGTVGHREAFPHDRHLK